MFWSPVSDTAQGIYYQPVPPESPPEGAIFLSSTQRFIDTEGEYI